jgi:hypothetical protein
MKRLFLPIFVLFSACTGISNFDEAARKKVHVLNWTCESLAKEYRENSKDGSLCTGYDHNGWPIEGAKKNLPKDL